MAVHLNIKAVVENKNEKSTKLHWMPCVIKNNGDAKVSKYFEPIIKKQEDGVLQSSFRGYPLHGKEMKVPENYTGVIFQENHTKLNEDAERNLYGTYLFDKFVYWNWDSDPSENDKAISAFDWLDIAEALHSPVEP